jgi:DNA-binding protein HU-beta
VANVTKQDFIDRVASKSDLSKRDAGKAVDAVLDVITDSLKRGDSITFTGFGKFSTAHRAARMGVNPRNPTEKVQIQASTVPKFSAGSSLKQAVKSGGSMGGSMGGGSMGGGSMGGGEDSSGGGGGGY